MERSTVIVFDFASLFIVCCLYAVLVAKLRAWYIRENKTWAMLVFGVGLVLIAIGCLIPFGIVSLDQWGIFILAFCVGGAPMVVGQLMQDARTRALRERESKRRNHDDHSRR